MHLEPQQILATSNKVISALQSTLTKPLLCVITLNILQKPTIDYFVMQLSDWTVHYKWK